MADENQQTPRVGPVSQNQAPNQAPQPGRPQQPAQQNIQRGIPGAQQPPVPSPEQVQEAMRRQQEQIQQQIQEARARAQQAISTQDAPPQPATPNRMTQQPPQPQSAPQMTTPPPTGFPPEMWAQMPEQMRQAYLSIPNTQPQAQPQPQAQQPQQPNQFAQYAQPQPTAKDVVYWHPARSRGVDIELTDTIIKNVPAEGVKLESDPQSRVVLALFSEILALREELQNQQAPQLPQDMEMRIRRLEGALYEQANAMNQRARSVREQIQMLASKGLSSEQIINELNGISEKASSEVSKTGRVNDT